MRAQRARYLAIWLSVAATAVVALSYFARVPYIYSVCGLAAWIAFGHLITIDDDAPGGWSNPENSKSIWHDSLIELLIKFAVLLGLVSLVFAFPTLNQIGA